MKSMVTIDARWLAGGIGTYTRNLLQGLSMHGNGFEIRAITGDQHVGEVRRWCREVAVVNLPIYTLREQWAIPLAARGCDLLHVPHYNAPLVGGARMVVSILDLIHIMDCSYRNRPQSWFYARPMLHLVARKAMHIVTVSEYSKAQIVERLGVPDSKVTVIYNGVDRDFHPVAREEALASLRQLGIETPYLLYIGSLKAYKNVSCLLRAFAVLRKSGNLPHRLLIVGDDRRGKHTLVEECARLGLEDRTLFLSYVEQGLLPAIYAAADLLVMPSRIEGFGLPVLEAMACGTPVVCSRAASLPEVGGDAVVYFDPADPEGLGGAIERVLGSNELRLRLRARGLERAKQFTWEEATRKHVELYNHVLERN
jgi:glycosyltransferase involved in cell wall biosynthesis